MEDLAKSYHNFIFPFIWQNYKTEKERDFNSIMSIFNDNDAWEDDDLRDWHQIEVNDEDVQPDGLNVNKLKYATYQYFQPAIRDAVFGKGNEENKKEVVQNFSFKPIKDEKGKLTKRAQYIIRKNKKDDKKEYHLDLTDIKLRLYNTGVGLLVFVCENHISDKLSDIKIINDYGRRITLPFIPKTSEEDASVCADSIDIYWDGMDGYIGQNFRENIIRFNNADGTSERYNPKLNHIADFIKQILNYSTCSGTNNWKFTTSKDTKNKENYWYIQPALDDRMFVMCEVNGDYQQVFQNGKEVFPFDYINALQPGHFANNKRLYNYESMEKSIYEFMFCDPPGECSCVFEQMRQQLIKEHLYCRWIRPQYGTMYSISAQAFMCVTDYNILINYFRTEYYEMACLVLAQRASLRVMQNEASDLSARIEKMDNEVDKETRRGIANLQEKLIAFQNQINLCEVSSQEQAIELYDMMREIFLVNKHTSILQEHLDGLYNIANIRQSDNISQWAVLVSLAAIFIALPSFFGDSPTWPGPLQIVSDILNDINGSCDNAWAGSVFCIKVIVLISIFYLIIRQRNK
ncbi:hypothetical protein D081_1363 [Anaerovibrio sp. JC8]|uniref:hypothetical protein n=1 Tax=Anaerovibrio sp. JC8 TaxID=1240085 RepID=UPI000A0D5CED|nr:hypothetical protein [Anaerovibrio sp. JC8]ORU00269.1 hypothetical protein D081_1363 [Anaerovibrio sp. JC8]